MNESTGTAALAVPNNSAAIGSRGVVLTSFDELARFAKMVESSGFAPKNMNAAAIGVAIQMGLEVGMSPTQALQSTAVINGRPAIYGDAAKALCEASGLLEEYSQWYEVKGKKLVTDANHHRTPTPNELKEDSCCCCVMSKRKGREALVTTFSVADAKTAGLWGKAGPWSQYPARMLMFRARGFNLRDNFSDVLKGLRTAEEVRDDPVDVTAQSTVSDTPKRGVAALAEKLHERAAGKTDESFDVPGEQQSETSNESPAEGELVGAGIGDANEDDPAKKASEWRDDGDKR